MLFSYTWPCRKQSFQCWSSFSFSLPSSLCLHFLLIASIFNIVTAFLAATMPPHQRANDCRSDGSHDVCGHALHAMIFATARCASWINATYPYSRYITRKLSLSPPNCIYGIIRTHGHPRFACHARNRTSGPARCVRRRTPCAQTRKTSKKRLIAASRRT